MTESFLKNYLSSSQLLDFRDAGRLFPLSPV